MSKKFSAIIFIVLVIVVITSVNAANTYEQKLQEQKVDFEGQVYGLQDKVSALALKLQGLAEQNEQAQASIQELQKRQVVRQKSQDELLTAAVAKAAPAVVSVVVSKDVPLLEVVYENPFGNDPFFKDFGIRIPVYRQKGVEHQQVGAGTGFLIAADGYILTNRHVVSDEAADYTVLLASGEQKAAQVAYRDPGQDIAILKIEGNGYGSVTLGNSDALKLGQTVAAIGNALGRYNNSVSVGIVSGLSRSIEASGVKFENVIQTDAAINPGNSGGPLLNLDGRVVGVNVATVIGASSISFSIPVNSVKNILEEALGRNF